MQLGAVFALFFIVLFFLVKREDMLFLYISGGILIVTIFLYRILIPVNKLWMGLAELLSKVVGTLLFSILFYIFLTPLSFLRKVFGGSGGMDVKFTDEDTFWKTREKKEITPDQLEKQF